MYARALIAIAFLLAASVAHADAVGEAFDSLLSGGNATLTEPGRVATSVRGAVTLGGVSVRFPRRSDRVQLFSITPPNLKGGCNGIDLHLGGFSYVSGEEIEKLMKAISQSARGMVIQLVITKLCPQCATVLSDLVDRVQKATSFAYDSCNIAQRAMNAVGLDPKGTTVDDKNRSVKGFCAQGKAADGEADSFLSAMNKACTSVLSSVEYLKQKADEAAAPLNAPPQDKELYAARLLSKQSAIGNQVWNILRDDFVRGDDEASIGARLLLMNLVGFTIVRVEGETLAHYEYPSPLGGGRDLTPIFSLFMCGTGKPVPAQVRWYCSTYAQTGGPSEAALAAFSIYDCFSNGSQSAPDRYKYCDDVGNEPVPLNQIPALSNMTGFLPGVYELLQEGIDRVRNNTPLVQGDGDTKGRQLVKLLQSVPYPLYQAINIAAVYPTAAEDLVASMSVLVAEQLVYEYLDSFLQMRAVPKYAKTADSKAYESVYTVMGMLRNQAQARMQLVAQRWTLQQALAEQIRSLNQAVQKQVLNEDMLAAARYATTVNRAAAEGGGQ